MMAADRPNGAKRQERGEIERREEMEEREQETLIATGPAEAHVCVRKIETVMIAILQVAAVVLGVVCVRMSRWPQMTMSRCSLSHNCVDVYPKRGSVHAEQSAS